jgi:hypothetical protein
VAGWQWSELSGNGGRGKRSARSVKRGKEMARGLERGVGAHLDVSAGHMHACGGIGGTAAP